MPDPLSYASPQTGCSFAVDPLADGGVVITIPSRRTPARVAWAWCTTIIESDLLGIVLAPLLYPVLWPICMVFIRNTPRAVLRITRTTFTFTATLDKSLGRVLDHREFPRESIIEIRRNQCDGGLYVRLHGRDALTLLSDLPPDTIDHIAAPLARALANQNPS